MREKIIEALRGGVVIMLDPDGAIVVSVCDAESCELTIERDVLKIDQKAIDSLVLGASTTIAAGVDQVCGTLKKYQSMWEPVLNAIVKLATIRSGSK